MFKINGGKKLSGTVKIDGSKNAVLPIIAATLLVKGKVELDNVPQIGDVFTFLEIFESIGAKYEFKGNKLKIDTTNIKNTGFDETLIKKVRVSILLFGPLLYHFGEVELPQPGGCNLGARPIDGHLSGFSRVGFKSEYNEDFTKLIIKGKIRKGDRVVNCGFGVTPTENMLVINALREGKTILQNVAIEPHVINLVEFLNHFGANIKIGYDHTIEINGVSKLKEEGKFTVISDYLESGTFAILAALIAENYIDIENARIKDLYSFLDKLKEAGVKYEVLEDKEDTLRVYRCDKINPVNLQTNIFPGFPTDLQSPFCVLLTQAKGRSQIFEILFEGRLNWLVELEKLGVQCSILNPHEAIIFGGKHKLKPNSLTSWDLRAGAAVAIACLITKGESEVTNIEYIKRGYSNFLSKLQALGADIREEKD